MNIYFSNLSEKINEYLHSKGYGLPIWSKNEETGFYDFFVPSYDFQEKNVRLEVIFLRLARKLKYDINESFDFEDIYENLETQDF